MRIIWTPRRDPFATPLPVTSASTSRIDIYPEFLLLGCGRKRSNLPALTSDGEEVDDSISALLELNAEPAVENLSRQIMSEAKLWEAIQEANLELNRHRQKTQENLSQKHGIQSAGTCSVPPCYI